MANIMDYLDWRGDLSFTASPFNEVDALILSEITYSDLDGIIPSPGNDQSISMKAAADILFTLHPEFSTPADSSHFSKAPLLFQKASRSNRFKKIRLTGFVNEIIPETQVQFSAVTYILPDKTGFIAFRGTDHTIVGWQEDFNMSFKNQTPGQKKAAKYVEEMSKHFKSIRIGGHSKGGNFAVFGAAFSDSSINEKIINIYSNDGPGFRSNIINSPEYKAILDKVISVIPEESMIGMILGNDYNHRICKSDAAGIMQHDAFSWQIRGREFETAAKPGTWSNIFNDTLKKWLDGVDDKDREQFVGIIFNAIVESSGTSSATIPEVSTILKLVHRHVSDLPKEKQFMFYDIVAKLVKSGGETLISNFSIL